MRTPSYQFRGVVGWWKSRGSELRVPAKQPVLVRQCHSLSTPAKYEAQRNYGQPIPQTHPHLLTQGQVTPGLHQEEFRQRRLRLLEAIGKCNAQYVHRPDQHIILIPSAGRSYMSEKIPYFFHQNTDFLYTTGFQEPNSVLLIHKEPGKSFTNARTTIFVQKRDPQSELWDGPLTGTDGAVKLLGVDEAYEINQLESFLKKISQAATHHFVVWYDFYNPPNQSAHEVIKNFIQGSPRASCESPRTLLQTLRLFKSPAEVSLMQKSCDVASEGFIQVMNSSRRSPCLESNLHARMEYECRIRGAEYLAYPPVVAGGNRANIIHYVNNNQQVRDGELVLMDAGCCFHGYVSDITRTWPVGGKFSDPQRVLYETVLEIQLELLKLCCKGVTLDKLLHNCSVLLARKLKELGIISKNFTQGEAIQLAHKFCPHHVSHYLGMDVHDSNTIPRSLPLSKGMVFTLEPGIYINENMLSVPQEFRGIGIRIEDDVLMTDEGAEVLSIKCPKHIDEIERILTIKTGN